MFMRSCVIASAAALFMSLAHAQVIMRDEPVPGADALKDLIAEALKNNPEVKASAERWQCSPPFIRTGPRRESVAC